MRRHSILATFLIYAAMAAWCALALAKTARAEPVIHLIVVADTLDPKIGSSVAVDMRAMRATFADQVLEDQNLRTQTIERDECHPPMILARIAALAPAADDALVVFFSGHGAYDNDEEQYFKFPRLGPQTVLTRRQVRDAIQAKGCRLGVLITDCCNNMSIIPKQPLAPSMQAPMAAPRPPFSPLFRSLFLETAGYVDLTSSKKGERSLAYPAIQYMGRPQVFANGGLFSTSLEQVLGQFRNQALTWSVVLEKTAERVRSEFSRLKPDGLDNEDEPENPQMTQTAVGTSFGVRQAANNNAELVVPDTLRPLPPYHSGMFTAGPGWTLGVQGYENGGKGIVVWSAYPGSAAGRLGLEYGDQVLKINDSTVRTARGYNQLLKDSGGAIALVFRDIRTGEIRSATVTLDSRRRNRNESSPDHSVFGAAGEAAGGEGIRVTAIVPKSPAATVGLDPGDVILNINGAPVRTVEEYYKLVRASPDEMWFTVLNVRTGKPLGTVVRLDRGGSSGNNLTFGIHAYEIPGGLYIWATRAGGPAARLRLERGDMVLSINGFPATTITAYRSAIQASSGAIDLTFRDIRSGEVRSANVTLDQGVGAAAARGRSGSFGVHGEGVAGTGIKVVAVVPASPAALIELDPGDVVTHINGRFVDTFAGFQQAIANSNDEMSFTLINVRTGKPQQMLVQLDR